MVEGQLTLSRGNDWADTMANCEDAVPSIVLGTDRDALIVDGVSGSNGDRVLQQVVQFSKATFFPGWHGSRWDRQRARFLRGAREGRFSNEPVVV